MDKLLELLDDVLQANKAHQQSELECRRYIDACQEDALKVAAVDSVIFWICKQEMFQVLSEGSYMKYSFFRGHRADIRTSQLEHILDFERIKNSLDSRDSGAFEDQVQEFITILKAVRHSYDELGRAQVDMGEELDRFMEDDEDAEEGMNALLQKVFSEMADEMEHNGAGRQVSFIFDEIGIEKGIEAIKKELL